MNVKHRSVINLHKSSLWAAIQFPLTAGVGLETKVSECTQRRFSVILALSVMDSSSHSHGNGVTVYLLHTVHKRREEEKAGVLCPLRHFIFVEY